MKRTGPTNINVRKLISHLEKTKKGLWKRIAEELKKPSRNKRVVNISRINRHSKDGDFVVVPGKVLSEGKLEHKINIAALSFSEESLKKIKESGSTKMDIEDMVKKKPEGSGVKIIG